MLAEVTRNIVTKTAVPGGGGTEERPSATSTKTPQKKRLCENISSQFAICIFISFICLVLLYIANGIFFWTVMRDNYWRQFLETEVKVFGQIKDYIKYRAPIRAIMEDLNRVSLNPPSKPKGPPPSELQILIERSSKTEEMVFTWCAFLALLCGHIIFLLPFLVRLRAKYRSWYLYLSIMYGVLAFMCLVGGSAEVASVVHTDQAYTAFEDLALNGSQGALMLASCQVRKNEFKTEIKLPKNKELLEFRDRHFVCQDAWWKLGAALLLFIVMILHISIAAVLAYHFSYLINNNIYPRSELNAAALQAGRDQLVAQIMFRIKSEEEQEMMMKGETVGHSHKQQSSKEKFKKKR